MGLIAVDRKDLSVGIPLPWAVCDQDGKVLLRQGAVLESEEQLAALLAFKPLRQLSWSAGASVPPSDAAEAAGNGFKPVLPAPQKNGYTFQDMRLKVGDRLLLQPPAAVSGQRYAVKLIGYLDNVSLLTSAPMANGLRLPLEENDLVVARIFDSQKAFGFSSMVLKVYRLPYEHIHLSFPGHIQGSLIRKSPRVKTNIIASIAPDAGDGRHSGVIVNLSADGALIATREPLVDKGQRILLSFQANLQKLQTYLKVKAVIRSIFVDEGKTGLPGSAMFSHGVQFEDLPLDDSVILQSLIYQQMIEQPHSLA